MPYNVWNREAAGAYLARLVGSLKPLPGREAEMTFLLTVALENILLKHDGMLKELRALPGHAPGWLRAKWGKAVFHEFDVNSFSQPIKEIHEVMEWIAESVVRDEPWLSHCDTQGRPHKLLKLGTMEQALNEVRRANAKKAQRLRDKFSAAASGSDGVHASTVMELPDGYRIVQMHSFEELVREAALMGNCLAKPEYKEKLETRSHFYYSLRDRKNMPHATLEVSVRDHFLIQCRGKENIPPAEKYFAFTRAFVERENLGISWIPHMTGMWQDASGCIHSIRNLPPGATILRDLDLSDLKSAKLPECLNVRGTLTVNGAHPPALPKNMRLEGDVIEVWKRKGRYHRLDGPAYIRKLWPSGRVIERSWYKDGRPFRADGKPTVIHYNHYGL